MDVNISPLFIDVNKPAVLTSSGQINKFAYMRYGERLRLARGKMTQAQLGEIAHVNQSLISQLENSLTATGSEYTARFARALGISVDWLADEIGAMRPATYSTSDPKLVSIMRVLEPQAEYVKDAAASAVLTTCELAERAKANGNNGTHG
jgi:transcriptional regulator with XRE-family HTH domain